MTDDEEVCDRDAHGFCRFASGGNWKCFAGGDKRPCIETSAEEARERIMGKALRALKRKTAPPAARADGAVRR